MPYSVSRLSSRSKTDSFDCGNPELNDFLQHDALKDSENYVSSTFVIEENDRVIGFYTVAWDTIQADRIESQDRLENYPYAKYSAIKLARLGVDISRQHIGIGKDLMISFFQNAARSTYYGGGRFITVDAKESAVDFYKKFSFRQVHSKAGQETVPMYLDFYSFTHALKKR